MSSPDLASGYSPRYRNYVLFVLFLTYVLNFLDRQLMTILLEPIKAEFGAEHGRYADLGSGLRESDDAIETVVIGDRDGVQAQPGGFLDEVFGIAGTVEEAE